MKTCPLSLRVDAQTFLKRDFLKPKPHLVIANDLVLPCIDFPCSQIVRAIVCDNDVFLLFSR